MWRRQEYKSMLGQKRRILGGFIVALWNLQKMNSIRRKYDSVGEVIPKIVGCY